MADGVREHDELVSFVTEAAAAILDAAPDGITVQAPDGRLLYANQYAAALAGFAGPAEMMEAPSSEILGRFVFLDDHGTPLPHTELPGRQALQGLQPAERLVHWRPVAGGPDRWSVVCARPVFSRGGKVRFVVNAFRDVTERQRAAEALRRSERRMSLLAATCPRLLDSDPDGATVLERLAGLMVPELADVCWVREGGGPTDRPSRAATAFGPAVDPAVAEQLEDRDDLLDGLPDRLPSVAADLRDLPDPEVARRLDRLGFGSAIVVPLCAGRTRLGDVTLLGVHGRPPYEEADRALAGEMANRAGLAAQNARLVRQQRAVASALQRALLPPELPAIAGMDLAARYDAASGDIGGDFYDVIPAGPSRWLIAIGDVCGKGFEAASFTAMVRYTLRAFAPTVARPSDLLAHVNRALLAQLPPDRFCTVACALLDRSGDQTRLTLSLGGHPRPLHVAPGGAVRPVGTPGTLLGCLPRAQVSDDEVLLQPGDAIVLFTDGVGTDSPGAEDDRLLSVLRQEAGASAACLAQAVEMVAPTERPGEDDLAVLVLRRLPHLR